MNKERELFIALLSKSMRGKKISHKDINNNINWELVIKEAKAHDVVGLIYSTISQTSCINNIDKDILEKWKKETFFSSIYQVKNIEQISRVFDEFNKDNIDVIALKGLVIRDLYFNPNLRSMGDADVLVQSKDLDKVKKVLENMGYIEGSKIEHHITYKHDNYSEIEVHWTLNKERGFGDIEFIEDEIWNNCIDVNISNSKAYSLGLEDNITYMLMHLASHAAESGFGFRQLADIVLLVEKKGSDINWNMVADNLDRCKIKRFSIIIFKVCNKLFDMHIPDNFFSINVEEDMINLLIDRIFNSGVHGKRNISEGRANSLAYKVSDIDNYDSKIKRKLRILFPSIAQLPKSKYSYARKYSVLLPIAWIHRLFYVLSLFDKDKTLKDRLYISFKSVNKSDEKIELINWLELQ